MVHMVDSAYYNSISLAIWHLSLHYRYVELRQETDEPHLSGHPQSFSQQQNTSQIIPHKESHFQDPVRSYAEQQARQGQDAASQHDQGDQPCMHNDQFLAQFHIEISLH
ncbi:hypothetical protein Ahy_B10g106255 isoform B [Arachis hypogaea]|uniref:Uncharacterized protein n=1 Tax=Arachis hypogaea TaxID=3818 RepID=A0A444XAC7_ARAHY|nr:hypothetical protein Ahy_B10g106255 isoform B [Arachis hypogaea]